MPLPTKLKSTLIIVAVVIPMLFWVTFYLWSLVNALIFKGGAVKDLNDSLYLLGRSTLETVLMIGLVITSFAYPLWLRQLFTRLQYPKPAAKAYGFMFCSPYCVALNGFRSDIV